MVSNWDHAIPALVGLRDSPAFSFRVLTAAAQVIDYMVKLNHLHPGIAHRQDSTHIAY
jgi:hypothetical protein